MVILQNVLSKSTPKMARTKCTARKATDGAAKIMTKASKNIAVKAPHKPPSHQLQKKRRFRPGTVCSERDTSIPKVYRTIDQKDSIPMCHI